MCQQLNRAVLPREIHFQFLQMCITKVFVECFQILRLPNNTQLVIEVHCEVILLVKCQFITNKFVGEHHIAVAIYDVFA